MSWAHLSWGAEGVRKGGWPGDAKRARGAGDGYHCHRSTSRAGELGGWSLRERGTIAASVAALARCRLLASVSTVPSALRV